MIQVMHTVANYVHDAKYKMPDRPLPCLGQRIFLVGKLSFKRIA